MVGGNLAEEVTKLKQQPGKGIARDRLRLELRQARVFKSGNVLLTYRPA